MVGMYPDICSIVPFAPELLRDVEEVGILWLQRNGIDLLRFVNMEVLAQLEIYYSFFAITIPEFINVDIDDRTGTWRIPIEATEDRGAAAGIGVLMTEIDRQATRGLRSWHIYGHGIGAGIGDIFLKGRLLPVEFEGMMHAEMRPELWMLGKPGAVMCLLYPQELPWGRYSGRPMAGSVRANPYALESSLIGRSPSPGMSGPRHIDRPVDSFMSHQADRGMDRTTRIPANHGQPAHRQPLAITDNTVASYFSDDTSTESNLSESESDTPKRRTKTKTTKGNSTVKSAGRGKKETQRRKQSSESESDDEPPENPKENVKKDKSIGKAARRGLSPSDDEVTYSADEQRQKGKAKVSARKRKPEGESQRPSKHEGRRNRGRSPSDDEAPPRVDPTEQARLDALKAQNGYGDGKAEKSGWH
ncbi:MAG: hypothetical protein LQ339_008160 [Xanthoria mediterranea]|nr:MAG: hypothetical protein LQ339_008160 [Xanthoria mediterranea]